MSLSWIIAVAAAQAAPLEATLEGLTGLAPDSVVYAAGHNVRVRDDPSTAGQVVRTLALGEPARVRAGGAVAATIGERSSAWVPVRVGDVTGWVWGGALTLARLEADLDADGEQEVLTVAYNGAGEVVVRSREPAVEGDTAVGFVNLGTFQDINGLQGTTHVEVLDAATAGVPLLRVEVVAGEYCGSGSHYRYLSLRSPGAGQPSTLALALSHNGSGGDAPVWWSTEVAFQPARKAATVKSESGEDDQTLASTTTRYTLKAGVFVAEEAP